MRSARVEHTFKSRNESIFVGGEELRLGEQNKPFYKLRIAYSSRRSKHFHFYIFEWNIHISTSSSQKDFNFILKGFCRLLNNPMTQTFLPCSCKKISFYQELLILFWKFCDFNKVPTSFSFNFNFESPKNQ